MRKMAAGWSTPISKWPYSSTAGSRRWYRKAEGGAQTCRPGRLLPSRQRGPRVTPRGPPTQPPSFGPSGPLSHPCERLRRSCACRRRTCKTRSLARVSCTMQTGNDPGVWHSHLNWDARAGGRTMLQTGRRSPPTGALQAAAPGLTRSPNTPQKKSGQNVISPRQPGSEGHSQRQ